jgi:hypothetical protein
VKVVLSVLCVELFVNVFFFFAEKQKAVLKSIAKRAQYMSKTSSINSSRSRVDFGGAQVLFLFSLFTWIIACLAPLVISYSDFLVQFSSST